MIRQSAYKDLVSHNLPLHVPNSTISKFIMSPPPAAPAPPPMPTVVNSNESNTADNASALFAEINALGENGLRDGLKKAAKGPVNDEMPAPIPESVGTPKKKKVVDLGGTPKCALVGKKWTVEFQNGAQGDKCLSIEANLKQTVYVFKCHDSLIKINGKVNAIVLDNCSKTACVFDEALASVELVNSRDIQIQCTKTSPAISIDGCTAVTYYLSDNYKQAQIITAKSAAVNLIRPTEDDGKYTKKGKFFAFNRYSNGSNIFEYG